MDRAFLLVVAALSAVLTLRGTLGQSVLEGSEPGQATLADAISSATDMGLFGDTFQMTVMPTRKLFQTGVTCNDPPTNGRCRSPYPTSVCCEGTEAGASCRSCTADASGCTCPTRYPVAQCCSTSGGSSSASTTGSPTPTRSPPAGGLSSGNSPVNSGSSGTATACCSRYCANRGGGFVAASDGTVLCCISDLKASTDCASPCTKSC